MVSVSLGTVVNAITNATNQNFTTNNRTSLQLQISISAEIFFNLVT